MRVRRMMLRPRRYWNVRVSRWRRDRDGQKTYIDRSRNRETFETETTTLRSRS